MRTLNQARESWQALRSIADVKEYRERARGAVESGGLTSRSIYWKVFLLFENTDHSIWLRKLGDSRSAYVSLRAHLLRAIDHPDEVDTGEDPLSEDASIRWDGLRQDEALRAEIMQDVDRCMPENTFFRQQQTHAMMLDILFIFCKLNPDVSYRQGMHEILAPILWVVQCDAVQNGTNTAAEDFMVFQLCDSRFIEHDAFTLFSLVMQNAKTFYEQKAHRRRTSLSSRPSSGKLENPILTIINRIFDEYLPRLDPELATHLKAIDLVPQVFLMRWIRLLFGREFPFDDVLLMWDLIFSDDPRLESVELICIVMMLRVRWDLLEADHNAALSLLLRYPAMTSSFKPQDLVIDALQLKKTFTAPCARDIIRKYTNRDVPPPTNLPDPDDFAIIDDSEAPNPASPKPFERLLHDAAKNVLTQGEKWGINKALRDAMDEVKRGVRDIQSMPTPQAPRRHGRMHSRSSISSTAARRPTEAEVKLAALQGRNEQLARLLKQATGELWECQRVLSDEEGKADAERVKELSIAIAKVGFVQVYLEDASIPLPVEEEDGEGEDERKVEEEIVETVENLQRDPAPPQEAGTQPLRPSTPLDKTAQAAPAPTSTTLEPPSRPSLSHSNFSWILGQSPPGSSPFLSASATSSASRPRSRGLLFGDAEEGEEEPALVGGKGTTPTRKKRERKIVRVGGGSGGWEAAAGAENADEEGERVGLVELGGKRVEGEN
ncbi:RabGAP/TBC [Myriangium duriaei CBS 260.36]|uniref:RabGAP/TBC n=1 Tax=Myriangium duriaei CBS 260.36 TaxID=1168546 RepID=A0A9P4J7X7_9PEZI|nr:RabGAP/TBC [Myriangium duriaei CBS 260.36]